MIKLAVIGRNFVVDSMLSAARQTGKYKLAAVYSRNEETGKAFADKWNINKLFTELDRLAADKNIDAVYIASPNICHEEQAIKMLSSGKHVLLEKPVCFTFSGTKKIIEASEKHKAVFMEAMMPVHMPALAKIKELLPRIGKIRCAQFSFCQYSSRYDKFKAGIIENAFNPTLHNGAFMDLGVYCLHFALSLFGKPDSFSANSVFLPGSIDGAGTMTCLYKDMLVNLVWSKITKGNLPNEIQGEEGAIIFDKVSQPDTVTLKMRSGYEETFKTLDKPSMYYELCDFADQINGLIMPEFNILSLLESEIMEKARAKAGIDFKI